MEWIKKLRKSDTQLSPEVLDIDESAVQLDAFKCHWLQVRIETSGKLTQRHAQIPVFFLISQFSTKHHDNSSDIIALG